MEVFIEKNNKMMEMHFEGNARELIKKLRINPEEIIISRNNEIVTLDEKIGGADKIKILSIISGG